MNVLRHADGISDGEILGKNASMPFVAQRLSAILGRTVVDKTGLADSYDFHVRAPEDAHTDITSATLEGIKQLGFRLQSAKGAVDVVAVESASQPTEN